MAAFPKKLGIVAGSGILPAKLASFCKDSGVEIFVIGIEGHAEPSIADSMMRIGAAGQMIARLREQGCNDLVIIGAVKRPKLAEMMPDLRTAAFFARLGLRALGDDGLLKAVRAELESDGFTIHGIQDFMPELLMPHGVLGEIAPTDRQRENIHIGLSASRKIGEADIGQSVVVCDGAIAGTEDEEGTNTLIKRAARPGAVLVKSAKPQQDRKLDMPTIGSDTITLCAALGYAGIAAEAGGVLTADRDDMVALANKHKLFLVGV